MTHVERMQNISEQCDVHRKNGFKIMVVYQPITYDHVYTQFYLSALKCLSGEVWAYMAREHKVIMKIYTSSHFPIDMNRNLAVMEIQKYYKPDYIFFMDTDQTFPDLTIPMLYETMLAKNETCVMAGMYFKKVAPFRPVFGDYAEWGDKLKHRLPLEAAGFTHKGKQLFWWNSVSNWDEGSIFKVDFIGAGCMMMPMDVFRRISYPYFRFQESPVEQGMQSSEDAWFCVRLHKQGIPIYINSNVSCGHLTNIEITEGAFKVARDSQEDNPKFLTNTIDKRKEKSWQPTPHQSTR